MSAFGLTLHFGLAIAFFKVWPEDYDYNHFNVTGYFLVFESFTTVIATLLYTLTRYPASIQKLVRLQLGLLVFNFLIGFTDEAVNRYFNGDLFLKNPRWWLPDLSMFRWWMTFDMFLPLGAVILFWYFDGRRARTLQSKVWGPEAGKEPALHKGSGG